MLSPASLGAQGQGTVSTTGGSGAPGTAFQIPVTLTLNAGVTISTLSFGVEIIANSPAPALAGTLSFTKDASLLAPTLIDTGAGPNLIAVAWLSPAFNPLLSGTKNLGFITLTIPGSAQNGQTYTIQVSGATATSETSGVELTPGPNAALTVAGSVPAKRRGQLISE